MRAPALLAALALGCTGQIGEASTGGGPDAAPRPADARAADAPAAAADAGPPCPAVAHIGDSLTAYTVPSLTAAYQAVGASVQIDAYGGRAVLQKLADDPKTGKQAALDIRASGFSGCWVVALGTNDTADVAAGAGYTRAHAIDEMMAAIDPSGSARVLWVNTYTTLTTGYYANANMILFNQALADATARWPALRVFDWASIAAGGSAPFVDGIHHTTAGYTVRNQAIAAALTLLGR
jgi:hypothetical protein